MGDACVFVLSVGFVCLWECILSRCLCMSMVALMCGFCTSMTVCVTSFSGLLSLLGHIWPPAKLSISIKARVASGCDGADLSVKEETAEEEPPD